MMGDMGAMMGFGWMGAAIWLAFLFSLGVLVLVAIGVVAGTRWVAKEGHPVSGSRDADRALALLRERYARGEITRDEFVRMRQDLAT